LAREMRDDDALCYTRAEFETQGFLAEVIHYYPYFTPVGGVYNSRNHHAAAQSDAAPVTQQADPAFWDREVQPGGNQGETTRLERNRLRAGEIEAGVTRPRRSESNSGFDCPLGEVVLQQRCAHRPPRIKTDTLRSGHPSGSGGFCPA